MLDDDFLPLDGYTPSMIGNSRSGSMRKMTKKEEPPKLPAKTTIAKPPPPKDDFDDLLQELTEKVEKKRDPLPPTVPAKPSAGVTSTRNLASETNLDLMRTNESFYPSSSKPATTNFLGVIDEKQQDRSFGASKPGSGLSNNSKQTFTLNEVSLTKTTTLAPPAAELPKWSSLSNSKKQDILEEDSPQISVSRSGSMMKPPLRNRTINNQPDNEFKPKQTLTLNLDVPEVREARPTAGLSSGGSKQATSVFEPNSSRQDRKGSFNLLPPTDPPAFSSNTHLSKQTSQAKPAILINSSPSAPVITPAAPSTEQIKQQHRKELDLVKQTYQRQLKFLTEQMDKVLREEKQSKERILADFKQMMAKEKEQNEKLLREEVQRVKEMANWQKEKMETMYKSEITSLKNHMESMRSQQQSNAREDPYANNYQKRRVQDLQEKLKSQMENLEGERKRLQKMQNDFEQRQLSFKKYRQQEEQKLKEQYARVSEKQSKGMRRATEAMREVSEEKQRLAMEMASMELELNRKKQDLQYMANGVEVERQAFEKGKQEMESFNNQIYNSYRLKMQEAEESKRRALEAENDLVNKLRIVELKAKEVQRQTPTHDFYETGTPLQAARTTVEGPKSVSNNWVERGTSAQRMRQLKESDRFRQVEEYVNQHGLKNRSNPTPPAATAASKFNLSEFMMGMDKYSRTRTGMHPSRVNMHS